MNNLKMKNRFILLIGACFLLSGIFGRERIGTPIELEKLDKSLYPIFSSIEAISAGAGPICLLTKLSGWE